MKKLTTTVLLSCLAFAPFTVFAAKLNVNTASAEELESLAGVGPAKAEAIVEYRQTNGPFAKVEDLALVNGIGEKTVDSLRSDIDIN